MEDAKQRKARLKALQQQAQEAEQNGGEEVAAVKGAAEKPKKIRGTAEASAPELKFRNYNVRDDKIKHTVLEPAMPPEFKPPAGNEDLESKPEDLIATMADKKPNQDLRRDVEKSLGKLERRTQRALVKIAESQAIES